MRILANMQGGSRQRTCRQVSLGEGGARVSRRWCYIDQRRVGFKSILSVRRWSVRGSGGRVENASPLSTLRLPARWVDNGGALSTVCPGSIQRQFRGPLHLAHGDVRMRLLHMGALQQLVAQEAFIAVDVLGHHF